MNASWDYTIVTLIQNVLTLPEDFPANVMMVIQEMVSLAMVSDNFKHYYTF